jgi:hypothetical protein
MQWVPREARLKTSIAVGSKGSPDTGMPAVRHWPALRREGRNSGEVRQGATQPQPKAPN